MTTTRSAGSSGPRSEWQRHRDELRCEWQHNHRNRPIGRITAHAYDELNRQVSTTFADGSMSKTIYSLGGRVDATIDANGNRTDYAYDSADRQVSRPPRPSRTARAVR